MDSVGIELFEERRPDGGSCPISQAHARTLEQQPIRVRNEDKCKEDAERCNHRCKHALPHREMLENRALAHDRCGRVEGAANVVLWVREEHRQAENRIEEEEAKEYCAKVPLHDSSIRFLRCDASEIHEAPARGPALQLSLRMGSMQ